MADFRGGRDVEETTAAETSPIRTGKAMSFRYGTCGEDLESGKCCNSNSSVSSSGSSEELYNGKLCVICYDGEQNCFFVPCGHCATCYICAMRIFYGENKSCPVCRNLIRKVRRLSGP